MKLGLRRLFSFSLSESRLLLFLCCCRPRLFFLAPAECSALRALISGQTGLRLFLAQFLAMGSLTGSAIITRKHWPRFGRFLGTPNCCREAMRFSKNGVLWVSFSAGFSAHYVPLCRWLPASAACRNFPFKSPISPRRSFGQRACSPQARLPSNGCCNAERSQAGYDDSFRLRRSSRATSPAMPHCMVLFFRNAYPKTIRFAGCAYPCNESYYIIGNRNAKEGKPCRNRNRKRASRFGIPSCASRTGYSWLRSPLLTSALKKKRTDRACS